jgi:hypothetical protein
MRPHFTQFIGSFETLKIRVSTMVLAPPAECHFSDYLEGVAARQFENIDAHKSKLKTFFGCLASGLEFLQQHYIHLPVSPYIILVHKGNVMFPPLCDNEKMELSYDEPIEKDFSRTMSYPQTVR